MDIYAVPKGYDIHSRQMLDYYKELYRVKDSLAQLRRELRLSIVSGATMQATEVRRARRSGFLAVHDYWRFIDRNREGLAITGSLALVAFGLVEKAVTNVDLVHLGGEVPAVRVRSARVKLWPDSGQTIVRSGKYLFESPYGILLRKVEIVIADPEQDRHLDDIMQAAGRMGIWPQ